MTIERCTPKTQWLLYSQLRYRGIPGRLDPECLVAGDIGKRRVMYRWVEQWCSAYRFHTAASQAEVTRTNRALPGIRWPLAGGSRVGL